MNAPAPALHPPGATRHLQSHGYRGLEPGPRLIVTGAVHGNETCGTRGIERVVAELARGEFEIVRGAVTFVPVCNPLAYAHARRPGERNLNRKLQPVASPLEDEDRIANVLCPLLAAHDVLLDLHSFRSPGRPFVLRGPADNDGTLEPFRHEREEAQLAMHVGPNRVVDGWMSSYAGGIERRRARAAAGDAAAAAAIEDPTYGVGTTEYMRSQGGYAVTLECGQHDDPAGPEVAWHAIRQTIALLGLAELPLVPPAAPFECLSLAQVIDRHAEGDRFVRTWTSFDPLAAGELIAVRADGTEVRAAEPGYIVFPDPTARPGHEWFYLAQASSRPL
jgi:predicted deacylase